MTLVDQLSAVAAGQPETTALVVTADRVPITYRELFGLIDRLAAGLRRAGLSAGDRLAVRAPGDPAFVVGLLAALQAGLVAIPLDPALPVAEQQARMATAGARAVLVGGSADPQPSPPRWPVSLACGPDRAASVELAVTASPLPSPGRPEGLRPDDAVIMFTGGTTGAPKMVPWTHDSIAGTVGAVIDSYRLGPQDATVAVMPLFHGHGLIAALLATLASGGTVLLPAGGRFSAYTFTDDLFAANATWFTAVPTIHRILLAGNLIGGYDRLRFVRSCSAPLDMPTAQRISERFGATMLPAYGMTEATHQICSVRPTDPITTTPGLVGRSTGPDIRIVGDDGAPLPPGAIGEVRLRGRTVVRGYLGDPAITAANFTDGWLHTGDLGSLTPDGALVLRGRIKELINRGGEKISPERVEDALLCHPDVVEAAVFGVPDQLYGETVAAAIVPRASTTPSVADLAGFCADRLARFEIPASIEVTDALPHTAKGSVDRRAVADRFAAGARR